MNIRGIYSVGREKPTKITIIGFHEIDGKLKCLFIEPDGNLRYSDLSDVKVTDHDFMPDTPKWYNGVVPL